MKLKIDDGSPRDPDTVYLRLVETDPDHILLEVCYDYSSELSAEDAVGLPGGGLLTITKDGTVALSPNIDPEIGFPLDRDGRLMLDAYVEAQTAKRGRLTGNRAKLIETRG